MSGSGLVSFFHKSKKDDYQCSLSAAPLPKPTVSPAPPTSHTPMTMTTSTTTTKATTKEFENLQVYLSHRMLGHLEDANDDDDDISMTKDGVGAYVHWTSSDEEDRHVESDNENNHTLWNESPTLPEESQLPMLYTQPLMKDVNDLKNGGGSGSSGASVAAPLTAAPVIGSGGGSNNEIQEYSPNDLLISQMETQPPMQMTLQTLGQQASSSHSTTSTSPSACTRKQSNSKLRGLCEKRNDSRSSSIRRRSPTNRKRPRPIPNVQTTSNHVTCMNDINLKTRKASLEMLPIRLLWTYRKIKRMGKDANMQNWQEDGPLARCFRTVLSMEVMESDYNVVQEEEEEEEQESRSTTRGVSHEMEELQTRRHERIRQAAMAAFAPSAGDGGDGTTTKKALTKRIRLYFYNHYAEKMNRLLLHFKDQFLNTPKGTSKVDLRDCFLLSLRNIPACCIFPYDSPCTKASQTLLEEYGRLARYCICIGCDSLVHMDIEPTDDGDAAGGGRRTSMSFDSMDMEIRVLRLIQKGNSSVWNDVKEHDKEVVFQHANIKEMGRNKVEIRSWETEGSGMASKYLKSRKKVVTSDKTSKIVNDSSNSDDQRYHNLVSRFLYPFYFLYGSGLIHFKCSLQSEIPNLMKKNRWRSKRKREIDICGVVLAFTCPKVTTKKSFLMRIILTDESLHRRNGPQNAIGTSKTELNIFRDSLSVFPKVMKAGDVLFAHRVRLEVSLFDHPAYIFIIFSDLL